jgi:hypothetical protein
MSEAATSRGAIQSRSSRAESAGMPRTPQASPHFPRRRARASVWSARHPRAFVGCWLAGDATIAPARPMVLLTFWSGTDTHRVQLKRSYAGNANDP